MTVESATTINQLNSSNPSGSDAKSEGDDHLRLLKSTLLTTFPGITGIVTATHTQLNKLASTFSVASASSNAVTVDAGGNVGAGSSPLFTAANRVSLSVNGASSSLFGLGVAGVGYGTIYCDSGVLAIGHSAGPVVLSVSASPPTPPANLGLAFSLPSDTQLRISVRGSDGVTRTANVTLS